jgi:hypothetical protein
MKGGVVDNKSKKSSVNTTRQRGSRKGPMTRCCYLLCVLQYPIHEETYNIPLGDQKKGSFSVGISIRWLGGRSLHKQVVQLNVLSVP